MWRWWGGGYEGRLEVFPRCLHVWSVFHAKPEHRNTESSPGRRAEQTWRIRSNQSDHLTRCLHFTPLKHTQTLSHTHIHAHTYARTHTQTHTERESETLTSPHNLPHLVATKTCFVHFSSSPYLSTHMYAHAHADTRTPIKAAPADRNSKCFNFLLYLLIR